MAFADWKQRSALLSDAKRNTEKNKSAEIERACAAAYKAGERDGRKVAAGKWNTGTIKSADHRLRIALMSIRAIG